MKTKASQEKLEIEEFNRRSSRMTGYSMMAIRDAGFAKLSNGSTVRWHVPKPEDYSVYSSVPPGTFEIDGKLFDVEELRKALRWA